MPVRIAIGMAVTVIALAIAGRRFHWLSRLIRSGQPAPDRVRGSILPRAEAELTEVAGQRKLLKWTVPGHGPLLHHVGLHHPAAHHHRGLRGPVPEDLPHPGHRAPGRGIGFIEDFFTVAVLLALVTFTVIRIKNAPARKERGSRFYGSHTRAAWMVLLMISGVMITLLALPGRPGEHRADHSPTAAGPSPPTWWAMLFAPSAAASTACWTRCSSCSTSPSSPASSSSSPTRSTSTSSWRPSTSPSPAAPVPWAPSTRRPDMDMENVTEDTVFGVGLIEQFTWKQMLDFATCTECGRCQSACPGLEHRASPCRPSC